MVYPNFIKETYMKPMDATMLVGFRKECRSLLGLSHDEMAALPDEQVFTLFYAYYHYLDADPKSASRLRDGGFVGEYDAQEFCGITGIFPHPQEDEGDGRGIDVLVALPKAEHINATQLVAQMTSTYEACKEYLMGLCGTVSGPPSPIEARLLNLGFKGYANTHCPTRIRFLLPYVPSDRERDTVGTKLGNKLAEEAPEESDLLFYDTVTFEVLNAYSACESVARATLCLDAANNICRYGDSLLANVRGESLRALYQAYCYRGLLAQNLRYFVPKPAIDVAIRATLSESPKTFWCLNNGIVIVCKGYTLDGTTLTLEECSIVNGGQTTHLIGELEEEMFQGGVCVPCKVIVLDSTMSAEQRTDFVSEVSEASNTQKPISRIDAVANRREQRELKRFLTDKADPTPPIAYQNKRGEAINKKAFKEPWQRITSAVYAQSLLSYLYQCPGTARNGKDRLFANEDLYRQLFAKPFLPRETVRDLNRLYLAAKNYTSARGKETVTQGNEQGKALKYLAKNGLFFLVACVGAIAKIRHQRARQGEISVEALRNAFPCYAPFAPYEPSLDKLFDLCLSTFIHPAYLAYCKELNKSGSDYSNFTKIDRYYHQYVLSRLFEEASRGFSDEMRTCLDAVFAFSTEAQLAQAAAFEAAHPLLWRAGNQDETKARVAEMEERIKAIPKKKGFGKITKSVLQRLLRERPRDNKGLVNCGVTSTQLKCCGEMLLGYLAALPPPGEA